MTGLSETQNVVACSKEIKGVLRRICEDNEATK